MFASTLAHKRFKNEDEDEDEDEDEVDASIPIRRGFYDSLGQTNSPRVKTSNIQSAPGGNFEQAQRANQTHSFFKLLNCYDFLSIDTQSARMLYFSYVLGKMW